MDFSHLSTLFEVLNSPSSSNEDRQSAQSRLIAIQRDPRNWTFIPGWLSDSQRPQIQFFAAQCLLVRINRDWNALEESEQVDLRNMIAAMLDNPPNSLTQATRNKLEECLVRVMEKAFLSGWWKDPIGDLMNNSSNSGDAKRFNLLALIPANSSAPDEATQKSSSYVWQHEIKSHSQQVITTLKSSHVKANFALDCIKNWCAFGAFSYAQIEELIPALTDLLQIEKDDDERVEEIVDCLVEIAELSTRDPVEEARKANKLVPICLYLASSAQPESLSLVAKLVTALCEECAHFLIQNCHQPVLQNFLNLLLHLTQSGSIIDDSDNPSVQMILNAWYALTEAVDSEIPSSNAAVLVNLFGSSLVPILISKATLPAAQIWSQLSRQVQQNFLQIRREFLDTLIYLQRALTILHSPNLLLEMICADLIQLTAAENPKAHIESRLRALMIISEECESEDVEDRWNPCWHRTANLIFSTPEITKDLINAKLAVSLIGSLLPLMVSEPQVTGEAVKMLLGQLQSSPALQEECISALQQAADADVPLLSEPETINHLIQLAKTPVKSIDPLIKLLSRLVVNISDESARWEAFNSLLQATPLDQLASVLKAPFAFKSPEIISSARNSPYGRCLAQLKSEINPISGAALLAAWTSLAAADAFYTIEGTYVDPWPLVQAYCRIGDSASLILGCKLAAAYVEGMVTKTPSACIALLDVLNQMVLQQAVNDDEEAFEALINAWILILRKSSSESSSFVALQAWSLAKISQDHLSVPFLRTLVRFLCVVVETRPQAASPASLHAIIQTVLFVGINGKIGRSGIEILARILHDISLLQPDVFRTSLQQILLAESVVNETDKKTFLRNIGAAHTIKKFKTVLVDFCLQVRGIQ